MDRIIRPPMTVLPDSAQVPEQNLVQPAPTHFSHKVVKEQPFYYTLPGRGSPPAGVFPSGTQVLLNSHDGGALCHVADARGLLVVTRHDGLEKL
jgi:hypothetical protein